MLSFPGTHKTTWGMRSEMPWSKWPPNAQGCWSQRSPRQFCQEHQGGREGALFSSICEGRSEATAPAGGRLMNGPGSLSSSAQRERPASGWPHAGALTVLPVQQRVPLLKSHTLRCGLHSHSPLGPRPPPAWEGVGLASLFSPFSS